LDRIRGFRDSVGMNDIAVLHVNDFCAGKGGDGNGECNQPASNHRDDKYAHFGAF
jgi:hypothetical protein